MKVAVIGSGTAGLAATWMLNDHSEHDTVHLFESDHRFGGHANTVDFKRPGAKESDLPTRVDTGFIVFNTVTYPNFLAFLKLLSLPYIASEMSFSVSRDRGLYEWAGGSLGALFAQRRNLFNPGQWRMVWDILRFNSAALVELRKGDRGESIGEFLKREDYSDSFIDNYLLPMTAAIWSCPPDKAGLNFPAFTLLKFMHNHHLLQILDRPTWLTLKNGSHSYVNAILDNVPENQKHLNTKIVSVSTNEAKGLVTVRSDKGVEWEFDHVVFATHADTTLFILKQGGNKDGSGGITKDEKDVLSGFEFGENRAVLHADVALMPKLRPTWSAWNYLTASDGPRANVNSVALTYWMNLLQSIDEKVHGPVLVTLNPPFEPKKELVLGEWSYDHPLYSDTSVASQALLPTIQNKRGLTFCGAWTAYGFHEDGFSSGLRIAANYLSVKAPFEIKYAERTFPATTSDSALQLVLASLDIGRRLLETPWELAMAFLVVVLSIVQLAVKVGETAHESFHLIARGTKASAGKGETSLSVSELVGEVRGFLRKSARGAVARESKKAKLQ